MLHDIHQTQAKASMGVPPNETFLQNRTQGAVFLTRPHGQHSCQLGAAQKEVAVRGWHLRQPGGWGAPVLLPGAGLPQAVRTTAECQEAQGVCWAHCWGRGGAAGVSFLCHRSRDLEKLVQETTSTSLAH